jgi:hypothetical protein
MLGLLVIGTVGWLLHDIQQLPRPPIGVDDTRMPDQLSLLTGVWRRDHPGGFSGLVRGVGQAASSSIVVAGGVALVLISLTTALLARQHWVFNIPREHA